MKSEEFCYWLQGFFELSAASPDGPGKVSLSAEQVAIVRNHLALVFRHDIDPKAGPPEYQQELQDIHDGMPPFRIRPHGSGGELMRC